MGNKVRVTVCFCLICLGPPVSKIFTFSHFLSEFGSLTSPPTTPGAQITGSLTREEDLKPQASDLDNLFESDSDDDAVS